MQSAAGALQVWKQQERSVLPMKLAQLAEGLNYTLVQGSLEE